MATSSSNPSSLQAFSSAVVNAFHAYGNWLVSISWKRFAVLALLLMVVAAVLSDVLSWTVSEISHAPSRRESRAALPVPPVPPAPVVRRIEIDGPKSAASGAARGGIDITIDEKGVRVTPRASSSAASAASAASDAEGVRLAIGGDTDGLVIRVPPGADSDTVRDAIEQAKETIREAIADAGEAARDAAEAQRDAAEAQRDAAEAMADVRTSTRVVRMGASLPQLAFLWIVASIILKITYKGRIQAEVKAAQAVETAEAESLRRQVVEARMAAMQAQVEPHFLFNTLASIDHLIETDPERASLMQKNLITLLRASMPTMRDTSDGGVRALGRELAVIKPYLEILKVRMEERLTTEIAVPDGLLSAAFPPMMIQTLVENAVKHGLEPKPDGGHLKVAAEVVHGKLAVTVADTGVGFGKAATAGTGVGLANIRERLQLLYGVTGNVSVSENSPSGTVVTITIPYKSIEGAA